MKIVVKLFIADAPYIDFFSTLKVNIRRISVLEAEKIEFITSL